MAKGDPALLQFVNGFVASYVTSGAYAANYRKWWGGKAVPPTLTAH
jgi:polar amino acid transport system substrate-binding protein